MAQAGARREKWTLSFDAELKAFLVKTARRRRVYPVTLLESIVKEKFNPYGHTDIQGQRGLRAYAASALAKAL